MKTDIQGKGWRFPAVPQGDGALGLVEGEEAVEQSIYLILSTAQGERVMRPDFGCGIHELVFQPNTATLRGLVQVKVRDALIHWEPRIDVVDVRAVTDPSEPSILEIRIDYRLRGNNALFNMVYPFFLTEGAR